MDSSDTDQQYPQPATPILAEPSRRNAISPRITFELGAHSTPRTSATSSLAGGSSEEASTRSVDDAWSLSYAAIAEHTYFAAKTRGWHTSDQVACALRLRKDSYTIFPPTSAIHDALHSALSELNCESAMCVNPNVVAAALKTVDADAMELVLSADDHIQIVESFANLEHARKAQQACFVRDSGVLVVWNPYLEQLIPAVDRLINKLVDYIWVKAQRSRPAEQTLPKFGSADLGRPDSVPALDMANPFDTPPATPALMSRSSSFFRSPFRRSKSSRSITSSVETKEVDSLENPVSTSLEATERPMRPTVLLAPFYSGCGVALDILICSLLVRRLIRDSLVDGSYTRLGFLGLVPIFFCISLYFCDAVIGVLSQLLGPVSQVGRNSLYYSGRAVPRPISVPNLPHFTIMVPVYKEGLDSVIKPTIDSVNAAINTYELQGGTANVVVCEDGMQLLGPEEAAARQDFYERRSCAWVARPGHNVDGYLRRGRFKKSSNMNVSLALSLRIEELMDEKRPCEASHSTWYQEDEDSLYDDCLKLALEEHHGKFWAHGNIRMGDYILLIDCDQRVPTDCFLDAALEMETSPEVGILQHCNGTFLAGTDYFERGIAFFTQIVNWSISWTVANGNTAPFMGHGAFLRWSALQKQAWRCPHDGTVKIWSEDHVSEDFVMSIRLLEVGYVNRWATYSNNQFLEGVSLSVTDEVNRWQKYSWGCSEMLFNPLRYWIFRGPITGLFHRFVWNDIPTSHKFAVVSYVFSYWAIAVASVASISLYFLQGLFEDTWPAFIIQPLNLWLAVIVVFLLSSTISQIISRFRAKQASFTRAAFDQLRWLPFIACFFGGLSYHILTALLAHAFSVNMTWSATVKDVVDSTAPREFKLALKRFWIVWLIMFLFLATTIIMCTPLIPLEWQINSTNIIAAPISLGIFHIVFPIVLNPHITTFNF